MNRLGRLDVSSIEKKINICYSRMKVLEVLTDAMISRTEIILCKVGNVVVGNKL